MKTKLLAVALLAGGSMFAQTRFSIGINFGGNGRGYYSQGAPAYASAIPPCPGPGYIWTDGYWSQTDRRSVWVNGYWAAPVYQNGYASRYSDAYVQPGYRGYEHRAFDRDDRDEHRGRAYDRDRGYDERDRGFRNR